LGDPSPERVESLPRALAPPDRQSVGENHGVHRPGARRADAFDGEALFLEQTVEGAPSEGAVRAAALKGEIDGLDPVRGGAGGEPVRFHALGHAGGSSSQIGHKRLSPTSQRSRDTS
jgi:hypothetical protein